MIKTKRETEKAIIVFFSKKQFRETCQDNNLISELKLLAETAGAKVIKAFSQRSNKYNPALLTGKGKIEEITEFVENNNISIVIFENELSPTQLRNIEQMVKCKILDKSGLILDIFAKNAKTAQAKLQVELAQLEYFLPRLTRQWTHLSKQYGGIGTKGPGETQIETDRRIIKNRISILKEKLEKINLQRKTQSFERKKYIRITLVGYTNAGKSTILNLLTDSNIYVENKLFATLDTSTRILNLSDGFDKEIISRFPKKVLISDTVGFINNLPHGLIESFKSTLSEVIESDMLIHVIDISSPYFEKQIEAVLKTLKEIGAENKTIIDVFNKVDLLSNSEKIKDIKRNFPDAVFISAIKKINIDSLLNKIKNKIDKERKEKSIILKKDDYKKLSRIYELAEVKEVKYLKSSIIVKIKLNNENYSQINNLLNKTY